MKTVILAGGFGTRLSEETTVKPKPMVEIGGKPIIWHILKIYSEYGFNDFIICLGYKSYIIKEFFVNYFIHQSDLIVDMQNKSVNILSNNTEPWKITLIETGENTMTGGRLLRIKEYLGKETFMMTYGDGVADINIRDLIAFHKQKKNTATLTAAQPAGRFGAITFNEANIVEHFNEKPIGDGGWVNAGFFVLEPEVFNYIKDDNTIFEKEPLQNLATEKLLNAFQHNGFWKPMDKISDKVQLEKMWSDNNAPWKIWK